MQRAWPRRCGAVCDCLTFSPRSRALQRRAATRYFRSWLRTDDLFFEHDLFENAATFPDHALTGAIAMSMQSVASPAHVITPPKAQFAAAYSGRRGLAVHRPHAEHPCRPQGRGRADGREIRPGLSQPRARRNQHHRARARGQRTGAVRPAQAVLLDPWLGDRARPAVSARADAARFRGTPPAPARAVGRLQVRTDEILSRRARYRDRRRASRNGRRSPARCCSIPR